MYGRRYNTRIYLFKCVLHTRMEVQIHTGRSAGRDQACQVADADDSEEETSNANRTKFTITTKGKQTTLSSSSAPGDCKDFSSVRWIEAPHGVEADQRSLVGP